MARYAFLESYNNENERELQLEECLNDRRTKAHEPPVESGRLTLTTPTRDQPFGGT